MHVKDMVSKLRQARVLVDDIYKATDIPQIQSILRHADQNLHWALWNLGEVDELRPDLPGSVKRGAAAKTKAKPKAKKPAGKSPKRKARK
ncbi:MAG: hypothetical protein AB7G15_16820 [Alphaproteobacteria bacterium]